MAKNKKNESKTISQQLIIKYGNDVINILITEYGYKNKRDINKDKSLLKSWENYTLDEFINELEENNRLSRLSPFELAKELINHY